MTTLFTRWIPSVTLAVWSTVLLGTYFTGRVTAFLIPAFRPGVLIAGCALALLALLFASRPTPAECCADPTCTHPLARSKGGRWATFLILVLPVSVAAWLSPEEFSKQAFQQRGVITDVAALGLKRPLQKTAPAKAEETPGTPATEGASPTTASVSQNGQLPTVIQAASSTPPSTQTAPGAPSIPADAAPSANAGETVPDYLQKTPEGYIVAEVLDILYAVQDSQLRKDFEGRTVQLIAQLMPATSKDTPPPADQPVRFKAVRMFMTCCAADSRPVATLVETQSLPELPEMTWVKIVGKATFPLENGKRIGLIQATSIQQTKPPEEAMLF